MTLDMLLSPPPSMHSMYSVKLTNIYVSNRDNMYSTALFTNQQQ
uniref:Uncharacterized protein n=1 Tax=Anguilla anguilla TaxID=7936 RepID=A0A0E9UND7_ANGAN